MKTPFNEIFGLLHRKTSSPTECAEGSTSEPAPPAEASAADGSGHESKDGSSSAPPCCCCEHSDTIKLPTFDSSGARVTGGGATNANVSL